MSATTESIFADRRPAPSASGGALPWLLTAGALFAGVALAKALDWRGHAHPRF